MKLKTLLGIGASVPLVALGMGGFDAAQAAGFFSAGDKFSVTGDAFLGSTSSLVAGNPVYALFCDSPITGSSVGVKTTPTGATVDCAKVGSTAGVNVSSNPLNVDGGFAPFINADVTGTATATSFGPTDGPGIFTVFTATVGGSTLTIDVDASTLDIAPGVGTTITFSYKGTASVTGAMSYSAPIVFEFTAQDADFVANIDNANFDPGQDGGIYDFVTNPSTYSNLNVVVASVPEPGATLGLGLLASLGILGAVKRRAQS
jgi:hypothetical protein